MKHIKMSHKKIRAVGFCISVSISLILIVCFRMHSLYESSSTFKKQNEVRQKDQHADISSIVRIPAAPPQEVGSDAHPGDRIEQVQRVKQNRLRDRCPHYQESTLSTGDLIKNNKFTHFAVDDNYKMIYCYIPKVGCTSWKQMLIVLTGKSKYKDPQKVNRTFAHTSGLLKGLNTYNASEIEYRLENYYKFAFVREPLHRLLSAFRNKFLADTEGARQFRKLIGAGILRQVRKDKRDWNPSGEGITFNDFLKYISLHANKPYNGHWERYHQLCYPCSVQYDFIGDLDTFSQDANFVLEKLGVPDNYRFPKTEATTDPFFEYYMRQVPPETIDRIIKVYAEDFDIFGYNLSNIHW